MTSNRLPAIVGAPEFIRRKGLPTMMPEEANVLAYLRHRRCAAVPQLAAACLAVAGPPYRGREGGPGRSRPHDLLCRGRSSHPFRPVGVAVRIVEPTNDADGRGVPASRHDGSSTPRGGMPP